MARWRTLGLFWLAVLVVGGGAGAALQVMGPPQSVPMVLASVPPTPAPAASPPHSPEPPLASAAISAPAVPPAPAAHPAPVQAPAAEREASAAPSQPSPVLTRAPDGTVAKPDPALLEPSPDFPGTQLPRIAADGRTSMQVYAPAVNPTDKRPKVAFLLVGIGLSDAESWIAINTLPPAVTLGISPYSANPEPLLAEARAHGHEFLITLPMESQGYPLNDSGPRALLTGVAPTDNVRNLEWVLTRIQGEAGVSGASDGLRGERFANSPALFGDLLKEMTQRGLLYVDPRPNATASAGTVVVTNVVDDPPERTSIDAKLADLEQRARDGKPAIGLAGPLRPVTVERIANWARGLDSRGINLVPVSAMLPAAK
jgi:polysaccharide deacetylase 2 family uncharacterized protein YibQ